MIQKMMKTKPFKRIGILGGSFNPAHAGHLHISLAALRRLNLDEVWWLVSPQNPMKSTKDMASYEERLQSARIAAKHPRVLVSNFEQTTGTQYSADTLRHLIETYRSDRFIWLMGADNLAQIHHWRDWETIFAMLPIAVFTRSGYDLRALTSKAAQKFARARVSESASQTLVDHEVPAWSHLAIRRHAASATAIRAKARMAEK